MFEDKKIGERFEYEGVTLEVVNVLDFPCEKCFFYQKECNNIYCLPRTRKKIKRMYVLEWLKRNILVPFKTANWQLE